MLTGTPLDLTPFGAVLQGIGLVYWLLVIGILALVLVKVKGRLDRLLTVAAVLGIMVVPMALHVSKGQKRERQQEQQQQQAKVRLDAAMARFEMHCKGAGEKIVKTVDNVEGLFLMKVRPENKNDLEPAQFKLNDPYGHDLDGEGLIESFFYGRNKTGRLDQGSLIGVGYRYVDAISPQDGKRYRYTGYHADLNHFKLNKTLPATPGPRYGVTYDDISTPEDRELWIAGSSLRVIDLQTNEVIAERIGYMVDKGQGSKDGFRDPWFFATYNACPVFPFSDHPSQVGQTRNFVEKVLQPTTQKGK